MLLTQINASKEQVARLMKYPKDKPVVMVNIIKYKSKTDKGETGKAAYARYFENVKPLITKAKAKLIWKGHVSSTVIGDSEDEPDMVLLVEYPTVDHFLKMAANPEYHKIAGDRTMALEYGGLIACTSIE